MRRGFLDMVTREAREREEGTRVGGGVDMVQLEAGMELNMVIYVGGTCIEGMRTRTLLCRFGEKKPIGATKIANEMENLSSVAGCDSAVSMSPRW